MFLPRRILEEKLLKLLAEDLGQGDVTTGLIVPPEATVESEIVAKKPGVAAGIEEAMILLGSVGLEADVLARDGEKIKPGQRLIRVRGNASTMLSVERTLLNILSRMSGIATTTRSLVEKLKKAKLNTKVACTRKTAPGLEYFDKKAVQIGGGDTHRLHLDDMILIKDNHIALAGSCEKAISKAKQMVSFSKKIEVEVENADDALRAARASPDIIMLDNFSPSQTRETCAQLRKIRRQRRILIEASGGIDSENIVEYASTGVDIVSLGQITQSPKALDMNMQITKPIKK